MRFSLSLLSFPCGPPAVLRRIPPKKRSPDRYRMYVCNAAGDGGGTFGGGSYSGGGGGGSGGGGNSPFGPIPLPLLYVAAWALFTEVWAVMQYWGMAARDAVRREELFGSSSRLSKQRQKRFAGQPVAGAATVSIIVPALNEEAGLEATLRHLQKQLQPAAAEIIVVDGGSTDRTVQVAAKCGVRVVRAGCGRARQMNAGAAVATGDLLVFAHADTKPPESLVAEVRRALGRPGVVLGAFRPLIEHEGKPLRFFSANNSSKTYYGPLLLRPLSFARGLRCLFGDQTLFCRAEDFRRVGGYDSRLPIMEDADLCIRMHMAGLEGQPGRRGQVVQINSVPNRTSGRRLASWGSVHATAVHVVVGLSWYLGATPEQLRAIYNRLYTDVYR